MGLIRTIQVSKNVTRAYLSNGYHKREFDVVDDDRIRNEVICVNLKRMRERSNAHRRFAEFNRANWDS